jgi:hypothetical protein
MQLKLHAVMCSLATYECVIDWKFFLKMDAYLDHERYADLENHLRGQD